MNACESLGIHLEERGARRVGRRQGGSYLHAPDRMPENPGTIFRGVRLRGPGL